MSLESQIAAWEAQNRTTELPAGNGRTSERSFSELGNDDTDAHRAERRCENRAQTAFEDRLQRIGVR